jgi:hypothetical protein
MTCLLGDLAPLTRTGMQNLKLPVIQSLTSPTHHVSLFLKAQLLRNRRLGLAATLSEVDKELE